MSHLNSIGSAIFTDLAVAYTTTTAGKLETIPTLPTVFDSATLNAKFPPPVGGVCKFLRLKNVREFPAIGASPNLVKVPVYGQKATSTIGGQSDSPDFSVTINYVGSEWAKGAVSSTWGATNAAQTTGSEFANMVGDGVSRLWRLTLLAANPEDAVAASATVSPYMGTATGLGAVPNSQFYFLGRIESLLVTPSLTDAVQATLAFSIQSDIYGAFTV